MSSQRFHIGKNGPAPCNAHPELPNGRACRFGEDRHGTLSEVTARWEIEQEAEHEGMLQGSRKGPETGAEELLRVLRREVELNEHEDYPIYQEDELAIVERLIPISRNGMSLVATIGQDEDWSTDGATEVERHHLRDGSVAYFKTLHQDVDSAGDSAVYGFTPLGMLTNEVNAYRISQVLGEGFDGLVPETSFRTIGGKFGVLQREVSELRGAGEITDQGLIEEDYRKAAIFDFVIGNVDRHGGNFLYGLETRKSSDEPRRLRLIDHGMSFYDDEHRKHIYPISLFTDNFPVSVDTEDEAHSYQVPEDKLTLREAELQSLRRTRSTLSSWIESGTISKAAGSAANKRISALLVHGKVLSFSARLNEIQKEAEYQQRKANQ